MSSNWSALHAQLARSVNRHSNLKIFNAVANADTSLAGFFSPTELLDRLHDRSSNPDCKNVVLFGLLRVASRNARGRDLAVQLLILALWPGLTTIRRRLRLIGPVDMQALDADLVGQLSLAIRKARVDRINRIAATLLRNVERDLTRHYDVKIGSKQSLVALDDVEHLLKATEPDRPDRVARNAAAAMGENGQLLCAIHLAGFTQKDVADHLGISHEAARKRCQRALARLKRMSA